MIESPTAAAESALRRLVQALARQAAREEITKAVAAKVAAEHNPDRDRHTTVAGSVGCS